MLYVSLINKSVNVKYDVPVDEQALQFLVQDKAHETINPAVETWVLDWPEVKEVMEHIASLVQEPIEMVTHQFLRLVETFEKKGAVIVNNKYTDKEQFLKVFKKYVKQFNIKEATREFPPDMAATTLACIVALKFQQLEIEIPEVQLPFYLNIIGEKPTEEGPFDEQDIPPNGEYWVQDEQVS